jgi:hypothetical protein
MVFVLRTRENGRFASEGFELRDEGLRAYEEAWQDLQMSAEDWAVALYDVPDAAHADEAIKAVRAGRGLILMHRDQDTNDAAMRELRKILGGRP